MQKTISKKLGFTILEVVLVLAIAGLIFLMVFIALPALQRSQRNTERQNDLSLMRAAMLKWMQYNPNYYMTDGYGQRNDGNGFCTFYKKYVGDNVVDPSTGQPYRVILWNSAYATDCTKDNDSVARGSAGNWDPSLGGVKWVPMEVGDIQFIITAICGDNETLVDDGGVKHNRTFAIRMLLEGGAIACVDATNSSN